jgi:CyaY protein
MTETEFLIMADKCLQQVEQIFEQAFDNDELDVDCKRSGNVLEVEFVNNGSKIIVNSQAPMQEMWLAARSGGFHYKHDGQCWRNTRDGTEFFDALALIAKEQGLA